METEATVSEFQNMLSARGVSRRSFMKLCGAVAVAAGLSELAAPRVAQALEKSVIGATKGKLYPVIWIEGASCTGCTESFAQVETPDAASIVLDMISLNYSETLSAAAGWSMEEAKEQTIEAGNYILVYEGAVLEGWGGQALRVADKPGTEHLIEAAEKANAVVALGSCAVNGGWMGAHPNQAGALGVQAFLKKAGINTPVVNVPGCPANPEWLVAVLADVIFLEKLPALNSEDKPKLASYIPFAFMLALMGWIYIFRSMNFDAFLPLVGRIVVAAQSLGGALVVGGCVTAAALALYVVSERAAVRGYATRDL